jgi:hypothetical protein
MTPRVDQNSNCNGNLFTRACILVSTQSTIIQIYGNTSLLGRTKGNGSTAQQNHWHCKAAGVVGMVSRVTVVRDNDRQHNILEDNQLPTTKEKIVVVAAY